MYAKEITARIDLQARPATFFVQRASEFKSEIGIKKVGGRVNAKSLLGVLSLGIREGDIITLTADGGDAEEAVTKLIQLVAGEQ
ncbi:phosphocarrier protein HPr [Clostridia bacterium]|nr:phosphocarrier protein HPr [Clostridia bacterium]